MVGRGIFKRGRGCVYIQDSGEGVCKWYVVLTANADGLLPPTLPHGGGRNLADARTGMAAPASALWKEDAAPSEKLRHTAGFIHAAALRRRPPALYNARPLFFR